MFEFTYKGILTIRGQAERDKDRMAFGEACGDTYRTLQKDLASMLKEELEDSDCTVELDMDSLMIDEDGQHWSWTKEDERNDADNTGECGSL